MQPLPPPGWRYVTLKERDSIRGLSGYEYSYPKLLHRIRRYDNEHRDWMPESEYRFLWDDQHYAVPKEIDETVKVISKEKQKYVLEKALKRVKYA